MSSFLRIIICMSLCMVFGCSVPPNRILVKDIARTGVVDLTDYNIPRVYISYANQQVEGSIVGTIKTYKFEEDIKNALKYSGYFSGKGDKVLSLQINVENVDIPSMSIKFKTTVFINYKLTTESGDVIYSNFVPGVGQDDTGSIAGFERANRAKMVAITDSINKFLLELKTPLFSFSKKNNLQQSLSKISSVVNTSVDSSPDDSFQLPDSFYNTKFYKQNNSDSIAVVIGNKNYLQYKNGVPNVEYAHNDAEMMKRYLEESLGYNKDNIIELEDATQANLISIFGNDYNYKGQLYNWVRADTSNVFIYYSGHGAPGINDGRGYLLPVDSNPNTVELNGYQLKTLYKNLEKLPAKNVVLMIDACFSGGSQSGAIVKGASSITLRQVEENFSAAKITTLTATSVGEVASWDEKSKMGLFTKYFWEGVSGRADSGNFGNNDGTVTLVEIKKYLEREVPYYARRLYMREQNPEVKGKDNMVFSKVWKSN